MVENKVFDQKDIEDNKIMGILAYFWILFLVPLFAAKESPFAKYHTNQGILLFIVSVVGGIAVGIVKVILAFIPIIGWIIGGLLSAAFSLAILAFMIIGILNVIKGEAKPLPIIGDYEIIK